MNGVRFAPALRDEVVARVDRLKPPSYTAFVMARLQTRRNAGSRIVDVAISCSCDLETQMYPAWTREWDAGVHRPNCNVVEPSAQAR
jgi:hypothetical protein